jgi:GntR family transcriptional repressor for pyruvate dehydrogenase complex
MKSGKPIGQKPKGTAVGKVTRKLREHALATPPGDLLGSEDQLLAIYAVSRPTLRQAAALVAQEQLLHVRRGVGGGYFARRPEVKAVAHIAAIYLHARATKPTEIVRAIEPIKVEMAKLAAANRAPETLALWRAFSERDHAAERSGGYRDFVKTEREFSRLLGNACGNRVLELFVETLYDFSASMRPEEDVYRDHPERMRAYVMRRRQLVTAIVDGDSELAALAASRGSKLVAQWMEADLRAQGQSSSSLSRALTTRLAAQ